MIPQSFIEELKMHSDIESVVSSYVQLKRRGRILVGLCPFHSEKSGSFTVYPESQSFYCFGCGAGGDVIGFIRRIENLEYVEAVKLLAQRAGMTVPEDAAEDRTAMLKTRILEMNREAARFYFDRLIEPQGEKGLRYLLGRGLTPKTIKHFGLGYAPAGWSTLTDMLAKKGYKFDEMEAACLARKGRNGGYYDVFRDRVMFPIIDLRGNVIAFGGRVMDDSKPKYINNSDTPVYKKSNGVFALNFAKNANENKLLLVEGYMDVIALHQAGFTNAIACLGTAFTSEQANLLSRYAEEIIICYDNDGAGREATQRALNVLGKTGLKLRVVTMSGGKDADEIIRTHGKERFAELLGMAANKTEYRLLQERNKYNLNTDDGKLRFLTAAAQILAECSSIECDIYATRLSNELGVSAESINAQIRSVKTRQRRSDESKRLKESEALIERSFADKNNPQRAANIRAAKAEETLIASLMRNPDFYPKLKDKFSADDFVTDFNKRIMRCLADKLDKGFIPELSLFAREFTPEEMGSVTRIYMSSAELNNTLRECEDCISVLQNAAESKPTDVSSLSAEEYLKLFNKK